jgi:hypothetical protein
MEQTIAQSFVDSRIALFTKQPISDDIPLDVALDALLGHSDYGFTSAVSCERGHLFPVEIYTNMIMFAIGYSKYTIKRHTALEYFSKLAKFRRVCRGFHSICQWITKDILRNMVPQISPMSLSTPTGILKAAFPLQIAALFNNLNCRYDENEVLRSLALSKHSLALSPLFTTQFLVSVLTLRHPTPYWFQTFVHIVSSILYVISLARDYPHFASLLVDAIQSATPRPPVFSQAGIVQVFQNTQINSTARAQFVPLLDKDTLNLSVIFSPRDNNAHNINNMYSALLKHFPAPVHNRYNVYDSLLFLQAPSGGHLYGLHIATILKSSLLAQAQARLCVLSYIRALFSMVYDDIDDIGRVLCNPYSSARRVASEVDGKIASLRTRKDIDLHVTADLATLSNAIDLLQKDRAIPYSTVIIQYAGFYSKNRALCAACLKNPTFH